MCDCISISTDKKEDEPIEAQPKRAYATPYLLDPNDRFDQDAYKIKKLIPFVLEKEPIHTPVTLVPSVFNHKHQIHEERVLIFIHK